MAPALVPKFLKRQARKLTNYVGARIFHEYDELTLKGQSFMRQAKEFVHDSAPLKVCTGASRVAPSFKKTFVKEIEYFKSRSRIRGNHRGRIDKCKSLQQEPQARKVDDAETERKRLWHEAEQKACAWQRDAPARATKRAEAACIAQRRESRPKTPALPTYQELRSKVEYMDEVRSVCPSSDDYVERSKRIQAGLTAILGPERMKLGVGLASGHSGINDDPILVKYNRDKYVQDTQDLYEQYQVMLRQGQEQQERKAAEQAAEMRRKETQLAVYSFTYDERVAKLAQLGPEFHLEIAKLMQAFDDGDLAALQWAVHNLIHEVLEPANKLFEEMKEQIVLEQLGAETLKNAWPGEAIDKIFAVFDEQVLLQFPENVHNGLCYMLQCIRAVCQPIMAAQPWVNPLLEQTSSSLSFVTTPIPVSFAHFTAIMGAQSPPQPQQYWYQTQQQPPALQRTQSFPEPQVQQQPVDTGKNFASFADFAKATKAAAQDQVPVPIIQITSSTDTACPPVEGGAPAAKPYIDPARQREVVLLHINQKVLDFQDNVDHFLKDGRVNVTKREENFKILEWMKDYVEEVVGILGEDDGQCMKAEIMRMTIKIDTLKSPKEKDKQFNKDIHALAKQVLKIWA